MQKRNLGMPENGIHYPEPGNQADPDHSPESIFWRRHRQTRYPGKITGN